MKIKQVPVTFKAGPEDGLKDGEFLVYPSTFIREPDSYGDVVAKGAFVDTIAKWKGSGNTLPGLYGHRMDDPDYFVAGALDMGEDDHGWWVKGEFDLESPKGPQVYRLVKGRRLNQLSFAYDTLDEGSITLDDGRKANELRKLDVFEFSFTPIGANQDTSVVAVKSAIDALSGGLKSGRVLAQKHIDSLRAAQEAIGAVIAAAESDQDPKASGDAGHKDEDVEGVKSEVTVDAPSVSDAWQRSIKRHAFDPAGVLITTIPEEGTR